MKRERRMIMRSFAILLALMLTASLPEVPAYAAEQDGLQTEEVSADEVVLQEEDAYTEDITESEGFIGPEEEAPVEDGSNEGSFYENEPEVPEESDAVSDGEKPLSGSPGDVVINETNFPDASLRDWVSSSTFDKNQDGILSSTELKQITVFQCFYWDLRDLTGLEYFTELETMIVRYNKLSSIDLSPFPKLKNLGCEGNYLSTLDLTKNPRLETLNCGEDNLTSLDLRFLAAYCQGRSVCALQ